MAVGRRALDLPSCRPIFAAMAAPPDSVKRLVDRFDQDRKACPERSRRVFLSGDYKEEQLPKAKTPHEQESLQRQIAATDKQIGASGRPDVILARRIVRT